MTSAVEVKFPIFSISVVSKPSVKFKSTSDSCLKTLNFYHLMRDASEKALIVHTL